MVNQKFYIGKHSTKDLNDGYFGSSAYLKNAVNKYGLENFKKTILCTFESSEEAYAYEKELITESMVLSKNCYNRNGGGFGWGIGRLNPNTAALLDGTHNFIGESHPMKVKSRNGTHPNLGGNPWLNKANATGLGPSQVASKESRHWWSGKANPRHGERPWQHPAATELSQATWKMADKIKRIYEANPSFGHHRMFKKCVEAGLKIAQFPLRKMITDFKSGWNPADDMDWVKFSKEN